MTKLRDTNLRLDGCARCSTCQTIKPASKFHKDRSRSTGLSSRCKVCESQRHMVRDLKAVVEKHPALADLIGWTGERLAA